MLAAFSGSAWMFLLEPMVGKMLLPLLGGSPAVWTTCLLFFQGALLVGYAYAHATIAWLGARRQAVLHAGLLLLITFEGPIHLAPDDVAAWPPGANPVLRTVVLLGRRLGLPFVLLAGSGPALQRWFGALTIVPAAEPYILYAASNAGSLLSLFAFPILLEPHLGLAQGAHLLRLGFLGLASLTAMCAVLALEGGRTSTPARSELADAVADADAVTVTGFAPSAGRVLSWIGLAALPSALLMGVTTCVTTDIAAFPLLWVAPLIIYLLTFILAFSGSFRFSFRLASRLLPLAASAVLMVIAAQPEGPVWMLLAVHLVAFFFAAMTAHARLYDVRPPASALTRFYLSIAAGGLLGGCFATILAPLVFRSFVEYPLEIVLACFLRLPAASSPRLGKPTALADLRWAITVAAVTALLIFTLLPSQRPARPVALGLAFGVPIVLHYGTLDRPRRFALGMLGFLLATWLYRGSPVGRALHSERSFFGVVQVTADLAGKFHEMVHGTTVHGLQALDATDRRTPLAYYGRSGPAGDLFLGALLHDRPGARIAVIGLGCGSLAAYARPGQQFAFYEIDPAVVRLARDPRFFSYLADAFPGDRGLRVVVGDARLTLRAEPSHIFDLLVLDAFSSDAIPVHLLVREALALYLDKVAPAGVIALHLSNRYVDLEPVVAALAADAHLSARCRVDHRSDKPSGLISSHWCALARSDRALGTLAADHRWHAPHARPGPAWTDDRSSIVSVLRSDWADL